jgi:hypothetical protein
MADVFVSYARADKARVALGARRGEAREAADRQGKGFASLRMTI